MLLQLYPWLAAYGSPGGPQMGGGDRGAPNIGGTVGREPGGAPNVEGGSRFA
jgi:hypothetical protein